VLDFGFLFLEKKTAMPKKKLLLHGTLKYWTKFTTQSEQEKPSQTKTDFCGEKNEFGGVCVSVYQGERSF